jgi:hypothetical protein
MRKRISPRIAGFFLSLLSILLPSLASAADSVQVQVTEALMELHTGPGRGYPVFYVAERGETLQVLKRRTDWFKVRTVRGSEGWVSREQMEKALMADGVQQSLRDAVLEDYLHKRIEAGFAVGRFDGDPDVNFRIGYVLTDNVITELSYSQISGTYSGSRLISGNLMLQPYSDTRFSPYFTVGAGFFENHSRASLVGTTQTIDADVLNAGLGLRIYLMRNFVLRLDYRSHLALTNKQQNDRFNEMLVGFSFFF